MLLKISILLGRSGSQDIVSYGSISWLYSPFPVIDDRDPDPPYYAIFTIISPTLSVSVKMSSHSIDCDCPYPDYVQSSFQNVTRQPSPVFHVLGGACLAFSLQAIATLALVRVR